MTGILSSRIFGYIRVSLYVLIFVYFVITPVYVVENGRSLCVFYNLLDIRCPGCGMTRAFSNVFHGNVVRAISFNRLSAIIFPLYFLLSLNDTYVVLKRALLRQEPILENNYDTSIIEKLLFKIYTNKK